MKLRTRILCLAALLSVFSAYAGPKVEKKGTELSTSVFSFLKKNGFSPETQSLVASGENAFPYNNIVHLSENQEYNENLLLIFFQEDIENNTTLIKNCINYLKENQKDYNVSLLFTYGNKQVFEGTGRITGIQAFIDSLKSNLSYTALIFDLNADDYNIETSSQKQTSPSWLVQDAYNTFHALGIDKKLSALYLSQLSSYDFIKNSILSDFFESSIPAIKINLKKQEEDSDISEKVLTSLIDSFSSEKNRKWEQHFLMLRLFGKYQVLSEFAILRIAVPTIFLWTLFIFLLFLVNTRLKKHAWSAIRRIWYSVPLVFIVNIASFLISRGFSITLLSSLSDAGFIYGMLSSHIIITLFFSLIFFVLTLLYNTYFEEYSIDYLIVVSCFINQSAFILFDISLSPIFITICLLALIALVIKNNILHVIIFVLMILPLVPYAHNLISFADIKSLRSFLIESNKIIFTLPFVLYPLFLIIFRTLTSLRRRYKKFRAVIIGACVYFIVISSFLIILSVKRTNTINSNKKLPPVIVRETRESDAIVLSYSDTLIFDDVIRTINIGLEKKCIVCDLQVVSSQNPVLYTDNDFSILSSNTVRFNIPEYPPDSMSFSYGTNAVHSKIIVSAVIEGDSENEYRLIQKSMIIGDAE
jgi:hypothetical protein